MCWNTKKKFTECIARHYFTVRIQKNIISCYLIVLSYISGYCQIGGFHSVVVPLIGRIEDFKNLPTSGTSRKIKTLKVSIKICSTNWYVHMFCIVTGVGEKKCSESTGWSFSSRPKERRISQRLFIRFWTCIYDYIPCFMRSMWILVCCSLTSWRHRDNDWCPVPCRA